ncbi:MAG: hypothetical protein IJD85_01410 [Oscillospiraceae bacterium]|nr:hypothetical protein [Oscillospiraceae bacterium]
MLGKRKAKFIACGTAMAAVYAVAVVNAANMSAEMNVSAAYENAGARENASKTGELFAPTDGISIEFSAPISSCADGKYIFEFDDPDVTVIAPLSGKYSVGEKLSVSGILVAVSDDVFTLEGCIVAGTEKEIAQTSKSETKTERAEPTASSSDKDSGATSEPEHLQPETSKPPVQTTSATAQTTAVQTPATSASSKPVVEYEGVTVYVSSAGKYHSKSTCSGMKSYTEMSLDEAQEAGHIACKRCWD